MASTRGLGPAAIAIAGAVAWLIGCSSGQDKAPQGSLAVAFGASRVAAGVQPATIAPDDPIGLVQALSVTVADVEARRTDGTWLPIVEGLPAVVDLWGLAEGRRTVTLPPNLLPEGQYSALQLRLTQVEVTRLNGTRTTLATPGPGWVVPIPVDFGVLDGLATSVALRVRLDLSVKAGNGEFEFEPEIEVERVKHD